MKRFRPYLLGMLIGASLMFTALRYHVIRHDEGVSLVPRSPQPPLRSVYSDVREWGTAMWEQHPEVAEALIANEQVEVISDEALDEVSHQVQETLRISSEKLQGLLSQYQVQRAAMAQIETTTVSVENAGNDGGVNIGRLPQGLLQNSPPDSHVPVVEEAGREPSNDSATPSQQPWGNPFDFQPRRSGTPTVGTDEPATNTSDAVALQSRDPWLRELGQVVRGGDDQEMLTSIPAALEAEMKESDNADDPQSWLPGLFSNLLANDGQTMHGEAGPTTYQIGNDTTIENSQDTAQSATSFPAETSIPEPEALREPIIQVRPF